MTQSRLLAILKIHPDEARLAGLVALFFGLIDLGRAVGDSAADALFLRRFGVEYLPYMYIGLGVLTFTASLGYAAFVGRLEKRRFFPAMLLVMALLLLAERAAIQLNLRALYPLLWLTINIIAALLGILVWTTASEACDTRQAKRLFPIFVTASILGGLLGSVLIGPVAQLLGTENLVVLYALLLAAAALLIRSIASGNFRPSSDSHASSSFLADIQAGFNYVKRAPLLQLLGISAVLFSILYFSVSFPFNRAVAASFTDEASLAGFLGLFKGVSGALMFVAALLIANRLYARIGIVFALLTLPITYLLGFILFAVNFSLTTAVIVRLSQLVVMSGIGDGAYSTFFNVVPADRRAQVRAFDAGVPSQIGIILSGILSLLGQRLLTNTAVFGMGIFVAGLCAYVIWRMRPLYGEALVAALRAGRIEVFTGAERIFAGISKDSVASRMLITALDDPRPMNQILAAEILASTAGSAAVPAFIQRLPLAPPEVKVAYIHALGQLQAVAALPTVVGLIDDLSPAVQTAALAALPLLDRQAAPDLAEQIRPKLKDPNLPVRIQAAVSLAQLGDCAAASSALLETLRNGPDEAERAGVLRAFDPVFRAGPQYFLEPGQQAVEAVIKYVDDEYSSVRLAACRALGSLPSPDVIQALVRHLSDADSEVRLAAAQLLRGFGDLAVPALLAELDGENDPGVVLAALPVRDPGIEAPLRRYAQRELKRLQAWREAGRLLPRGGRATTFLASLIDTRAAQAMGHFIQVVGLLGDERVMHLVSQSLQKPDAETRATAVEALDTLGDKQLIKDFIPLLEDSSAGNDNTPITSSDLSRCFRFLLSTQDLFVKACAIRAAGELEIIALLPEAWQYGDEAGYSTNAALGESHPPIGGQMETLQTLSLVERTLLLRDIPLFSDLAADDLLQVAQTAQERWFDDGAVLCRQGEMGEDMFVIAAGQVRVTHQMDAQEKELAVRQTGEFIGEMAVIESAPRFATVTAVGEVRTMVITAAAFKAILRERPEVSLAVIRGLSHRLREIR